MQTDLSNTPSTDSSLSTNAQEELNIPSGLSSTKHTQIEKVFFQKPIDLDYDLAMSLIGINGDYDILKLLTTFEKAFYHLIKIRQTKDLRQLTDAKNTLLRFKIKDMIRENEYFDLSEMIPFTTSCVECKGTGEKYKFLKGTKIIPCDKCLDSEGNSTGEVMRKCFSCDGTGTFTKTYGNKTVTGICKKCDEENPGTRKFICHSCRGTKEFKKLIIEPEITTITHCKVCKGRGFIQPEFLFKPSQERFNPVISDPEKLGDLIKKVKMNSE